MELMEIMWADGTELSCSELMEQLKEDWKQSTIQTFLKRLCDKGALSVRKEGKNNFYTPEITRGQYKGEKTAEFLNEMHGGSLESLLDSIFRYRKPNEDEITHLSTWIKNI